VGIVHRLARSERGHRAAVAAALGFPFLFLVAFVAFPLWEELGGSFASWYQLKPNGFGGLSNYAALFRDVMVPVSALHTVFYVLLTVPVEIGLGLAARACSPSSSWCPWPSPGPWRARFSTGFSTCTGWPTS
jgi:ABC-type sugar transport system permease subunit